MTWKWAEHPIKGAESDLEVIEDDVITGKNHYFSSFKIDVASTSVKMIVSCNVHACMCVHYLHWWLLYV